MIRYDGRRRRLWIAGYRIHHGELGIALIAIGAALLAHDFKDFKAGFPDGQ